MPDPVVPKNFSPIFQTFLGKSALAVLTKGEGKKSIKTMQQGDGSFVT